MKRWLLIGLFIFQITSLRQYPLGDAPVSYALEPWIRLYIMDTEREWVKVRVEWDGFLLLPKGSVEGWLPTQVQK